MGAIHLFTASYRNFTADMGLPIQSSNGKPRWPLPYNLNHRMPDTFPNWSWVKSDLSQEDFQELYFKKMDNVGVEEFVKMFTAVSELTGQTNLVLLCFEDLNKAWCHRRMFAQWWLERTGEEIPDLG